jgi:hypothetical protein
MDEGLYREIIEACRPFYLYPSSSSSSCSSTSSSFCSSRHHHHHHQDLVAAVAAEAANRLLPSISGMGSSGCNANQTDDGRSPHPQHSSCSIPASSPRLPTTTAADSGGRTNKVCVLRYRAVGKGDSSSHWLVPSLSFPTSLFVAAASM